MKIDSDFMLEAIACAKQAKSAGDPPFGAVIVRNGDIVGHGICSEKTEQRIVAHAEMNAIDEANRAIGSTNLSDCTIYCSNEPCIMCAAAIFQAKIPRIVIAMSREDAPLRLRNIRIEDIAEDSGYEVEITKGLEREAAIQNFGDWGRK